jgi:hypothetical protein
MVTLTNGEGETNSTCKPTENGINIFLIVLCFRPRTQEIICD